MIVTLYLSLHSSNIYLMQKVEVLIERLVTQYNDNVDKRNMVVTTQMLLSELQKKEQEDSSYYPPAVSVFLPFYYPSEVMAEETVIKEPEIKEDIKTETKEIAPEPEQHINEKEQIYEDEQKAGQNYFDPMVEIPTLALKQQEVNDTIAANGESLNDKLKTASPYKEVGHSIKDTPVKDLRKAIGINDRYVFINELFRGDETMYERSIKTINGYNNYAEAEFWIKRELKLKLGWNDDTPAVQLFDRLVRRRFA